MGVFDQEIILPGAITEIVSDYSYGYDTSKFGTTDSITLIGTAFNGPVGVPVAIYSPEHAKYIFGDTYNYKTRKEATLVAEIQDAYDRGCRTIYGLRVSGKPIHKDFQFAVDTDLKLRVSGIFPSNENKDVYMVFDDAAGAMTVKIYKPAKKATIQEKIQGLVDREDSILVSSIDLSNSLGMTKETRLSELLKVVNQSTANNVIRLSIVNAEGNDVTISSDEAKNLAIGVMFPGAYFIGRDKNKVAPATGLSYVFADATHKPFESFEGIIFKTLEVNTDVTESLPICGDIELLNSKFSVLNVGMSKMFDILEVIGGADRLFGKDDVDYEEVGIADFDLYKRLGTGYAITARAELTASGTDIRIKETPATDEANRIQPIHDGIYSMLENLKSDYRVLTLGAADAPIVGKLPKKTDFKIARALEHSILGGHIKAKVKVDPKDLTAPKDFAFKFNDLVSELGSAEAVQPLLYTAKVVKRVAKKDTVEQITGTFPAGTLFMVLDTLYRFDGVAPVALEDGIANADLVGKLFMVDDKILQGTLVDGSVSFVELQIADITPFSYVLVESGGTVAVYYFDKTKLAIELVPIGSLHEVFGDKEDKTLATIQAEYGVLNTVTIQSAEFAEVTLEEFVALLNEDQDLKRFFEFSIVNELEKDDTVSTFLGLEVNPLVLPTTSVTKKDKEITFDTALFIPYKTTDNFARHLAQHCTYTGLKTAPTHGIMGVSKLADVNLSTVAKKVDQLNALALNFTAKKSNGRDMLDRNNNPYPIGRTISIVVGQYVVTDGTGYSYISNGAAGYAGKVSVLPLDQSSTSQPIDIPTPMYELTNYQLEKLTQKGFVTFKQSYTRGFVITDGITMAGPLSQFRRLSVARITNAVEEVIRKASEPFIGRQNHLSNRNSLDTAIRSELAKMKGKLIAGYKFQLVVDPAALKFGIIDIDYTIVPVYEIQAIRNRISVKESL